MHQAPNSDAPDSQSLALPPMTTPHLATIVPLPEARALKVIDASPYGRAAFLTLLGAAEYPSIAATMKVQKEVLPSEDMQLLLQQNKNIYIALEDRISTAEIISATGEGTQQLANSTRAQWNNDPALAGRVFWFENCKSSHIKFFLLKLGTAYKLLVGNTNFDNHQRRLNGEPLKDYSKIAHVNFLCSIDDEQGIHEFMSHIWSYLPSKPVNITGIFKDALKLSSTALSTMQVNMGKLEQVFEGKPGRLFAWGPAQHKDILMHVLATASRLTIIQQDIQYQPIQELLTERSKAETQIEIFMAECPFKENNRNPAMGFLKEVAQYKQNTVRIALSRNSYGQLYGGQTLDTVIHPHAKIILAYYQHNGTTLLCCGSANLYGEVMEVSYDHLNSTLITNDPQLFNLIKEQYENYIQKEGVINIRDYTL